MFAGIPRDSSHDADGSEPNDDSSWNHHNLSSSRSRNQELPTTHHWQLYDEDPELEHCDLGPETPFLLVSFPSPRRPSVDFTLTESIFQNNDGELKSLEQAVLEEGVKEKKEKHEEGNEKNASWCGEKFEDPEDLITLGVDSCKIQSHADEDVYPDGGLKAWMMVFGGVLNMFSTFGYINAWGIFQSYYQNTILKDSSPSNIAWIGSIQFALTFFSAIFIGRLFDMGYFRSIFLFSSVVLVTTTFLVAECRVYWQFLLCQGFVVGFASGGIYGPTMAIIAHWFKRRRGSALGFASMGSSIGGSVLSVTAKNLIPRVGFAWTMRILGFILTFTLAVSGLILKRRLPPKDVSGGLVSLRAFRSPAFTTYCLSVFTIFLGMFTMLTYIDVSAMSVPGTSVTLAFYLVSIVNGSSFVGRYVCGILCDRVGPMNVMIPFTALAGVMTFIWPYSRTVYGLVTIAVVYGFSSGAFGSLLPNPMIDLGDMDDVGRRLGMFMSIAALGALTGPPISGMINKATGGFEAVGWYAGSMILLGALMMSTARWLVLKKWWGRM